MDKPMAASSGVPIFRKSRKMGQAYSCERKSGSAHFCFSSRRQVMGPLLGTTEAKTIRVVGRPSARLLKPS